MAITTMDGLIAGLAGGRDVYMYKTTSTTTIAGNWCSFYEIGGAPALPTIPSSAHSTCTSTDAGALAGMPGSTDLYYIAGAWVNATAIQSFTLFDRLAHCGNLVGNSTAVQAVTVSSTGSRDTGRISTATSLDWFLEWYTTTGTTAATITVNLQYTDGSTGVFTYTTPSTMRQSRLVPIISTVGKNIESIQQATLSVTTGTAGSFGFTCARRLCEVPNMVANYGVYFDAFDLGMPNVLGNACLWMASIQAATASGVTQTKFRVIPG